MRASDFTFRLSSFDELADVEDEVVSAIKTHGLAIFPAVLGSDPLYQAYLQDLLRLTAQLYAVAHEPFDPSQELGELLTHLAVRHRNLVGSIYDIGTGPQKLMTGNALKAHPAFMRLLRALFGDEAVLATPTVSDTLHVFPPGADSYRFNLPMHQDYPYSLQSPAQMTFWLNLGRRAEGANLFAPVPETASTAAGTAAPV